MTVAELREKLAGLPGDGEVIVDSGEAQADVGAVELGRVERDALGVVFWPERAGYLERAVLIGGAK